MARWRFAVAAAYRGPDLVGGFWDQAKWAWTARIRAMGIRALGISARLDIMIRQAGDVYIRPNPLLVEWDREKFRAWVHYSTHLLTALVGLSAKRHVRQECLRLHKEIDDVTRDILSLVYTPKGGNCP